MPIKVEESPEPQPVNRLAALPEPPTAPPTPVGKPSIRAVLDQIDIMRDSLRSTVRQFGDVVEALRLIDKERRTIDREVELVREKLRALQAVSF